MTERASPAGASNALATEPSAYLRQHAQNPVSWHPWGPEALELARRERKPILLSIGYAACHWCHVMAHESFEDRATAALMNDLYVNIKVDREERPDLDRLYQLAHQMLTGRGGGWPLTMFLMHDDQRPFFGGTYFPPQARFGLPAFRDLLQQVAAYYQAHVEELRAPAAQIVSALADLNPHESHDSVLTREPLQACRAGLERSFEREYGGFSSAPKFPSCAPLARLLRDWHDSAGASVPDLQALYMAGLTLTRMAEGGLIDQLGGGFYRYSVDERWEIPHFEKMLYDNAQLLRLYAEAAAATGEPLFRDSAVHAAEWLQREMAAPGGAFYASIDADSEGHEGKFYVWDRDAARGLLAAEEWGAAEQRFGLDRSANFEGRWHLTARVSIAEIAQTQRLDEATVPALLASARQKLLTARAERVRPGLDDKILTSWNALTIAGLSTAGRLLERPDFSAAADASARYLHQMHWRDGRLLATSRADGSAARLSAYLDDHAFLLDALLELASTRFRVEELNWAVQLAELLLTHFEDREHGGFFFTADDHEALISRPKSFGDDALPSGNAIAARALLRLGFLLGEPRYLDAAERTLRAAWPAVMRYPEAHASMLLALDDYLTPPVIVILRGPDFEIQPWHRELTAVFAPSRWTLAIADDVAGLPLALAAKRAGSLPTAYICHGLQCSAPINSLRELLDQLNVSAGETGA